MRELANNEFIVLPRMLIQRADFLIIKPLSISTSKKTGLSLNSKVIGIISRVLD